MLVSTDSWYTFCLPNDFGEPRNDSVLKRGVSFSDEVLAVVVFVFLSSFRKTLDKVLFMFILLFVGFSTVYFSGYFHIFESPYTPKASLFHHFRPKVASEIMNREFKI